MPEGRAKIDYYSYVIANYWGSKYKVRTFHVFLNMSKFTRFWGGPNGPKIYVRRTKTDFKDRDLGIYI